MNSGAYEGAWASPPLHSNFESRAPFASTLAGPGAPVAAPGGVIQGRFAWLNPATGLASNTRVTAGDALGVVIPLRSTNGANGGVIGGAFWLGGPHAVCSWQFYDPTVNAWRIRQGLVVTMYSRGNFWLKFAAGAIYGQNVYASLVDGSAISSATDNAELTPWIVCSMAPPGALAMVSTSAFFSA